MKNAITQQNTNFTQMFKISQRSKLLVERCGAANIGNSFEYTTYICTNIPLKIGYTQKKKNFAMIDYCALKYKENKSITMMRGKSPQSDVEMTKTLNFLAAILDLWRPSGIYNRYLISLYSIYGNDHFYQF